MSNFKMSVRNFIGNLKEKNAEKIYDNFFGKKDVVSKAFCRFAKKLCCYVDYDFEEAYNEYVEWCISEYGE